MVNITLRLLVFIPVSFLFFNPAYADTALLDVKVRHDKKFDFSQLDNNYQWIKRKDSSREHIASIDPDINEYFLSVVNKNLADKGFNNVYKDSASFGVDYEVIIKSSGVQNSLEEFSSQVRQSRLSKTHIASLPNIKNMKAGTIVLNIMSIETGHLIWIGYAEAVVVDKKNREELIDKAISAMLAEFPPK